MNSVGIPGGSPPEIVSEETARMLQFVRRHRDLYEWRREEFGRLATAFPGDLDLPLRIWQQRYPSSRTASIDAFSRLFGRDIDLEADT